MFRGVRPTLQPVTPKDEVDSIQTFLDDNRGGVAVISRDLLPPPSPTVTMTMNTRAAMQDVNAMFKDGDSCSENFVYDDDETEEKNEDTNDIPPQLNVETPTFEIYEDKDDDVIEKNVEQPAFNVYEDKDENRPLEQIEKPSFEIYEDKDDDAIEKNVEQPAFEIYEDKEDIPPEKAVETIALSSTEEKGLDVPKETSDVPCPREQQRCGFAATVALDLLLTACFAAFRSRRRRRTRSTLLPRQSVFACCRSRPPSQLSGRLPSTTARSPPPMR